MNSLYTISMFDKNMQFGKYEVFHLTHLAHDFGWDYGDYCFHPCTNLGTDFLLDGYKPSSHTMHIIHINRLQVMFYSP